MSKRNNQAAKSAARERLRVQREAEAKKARVRRQLVVAGSVVGVLAIAGGIAYVVVQNSQPTYWESAASDPLVKPANTSGERGTTVLIGEDGAEKTLQMYEDPRCPICATFEQAVGETLEQDVKDGTYKVQFIGATFLDGPDGAGSKNALSALGAALEVSEQAFMDYKAALYSAEWHPEETEDKFADDDYLIEIANTVPELKGDQAFQKDVKDGTFDKWALEMSEKFDESGVRGTPTLMMDGEKVTVPGSDNTPMTPDDYGKALDAALKA